jgi:hypothetical protein
VNLGLGGEKTVRRVLGLEGRAYSVDLYGFLSLLPPEDDVDIYSFRDEARQADRIAAARIALGDGAITFVTESRPFARLALGQHDHAEWFVSLVTDWDRPKEALFVRAGAPPSFFSLMWKHAWFALVSLGLLLAGMLFHHGLRFGPLLPRAERDRRNLLEHVHATGRFLWKHGQHDRLLASMRASVRRSLAAAGSDASAIAARSRRPVESVRVALEGSPDGKRLPFLRIVQELQLLRRKR